VNHRAAWSHAISATIASMILFTVGATGRSGRKREAHRRRRAAISGKVFIIAPPGCYQSGFQPGGGVDRQPVPFRGLGGGHQHLHTLGRRERAGDRVIDAHAAALALVLLAVLLETCMQAALAQPHIHHQIIDHKRIDAGNAGGLGFKPQDTCRVARPFAQQTEARVGQDFPRCGRESLGGGIDRHGFALDLDLPA
jgi:hypothetical protein